jgi:DNA processing protein
MNAERAARLSWARISEPADDQAAALIAALGHVDALRRVRSGEVPAGVGTVGDQRWRGWQARAETVDVERELEMADRVGARIIFPGDAEWPERLDDLDVPPHCLWVRGEAQLAEVTGRSCAVVGSRAATAYGCEVAQDLSFGLAGRGVTVVSGAAFGIDAAAHRGALAAERPTVALLACGVDRDYPTAHAGLLRRVRADGLVVSEVPIGSSPLRTRFLARNRIIAALTSGTVVVEAGLRSGSLNTAGHASHLGRVVCAVPGPVGSHVSAGCHALVREGAVLVTDAAEVAEALGAIGEALAPVKQVRGPDADWSPLDRQVHAVVPVRSGWPVDRIVKEVGCAPLAVIASLGRLEAEGAIRVTERGWQKAPQRTRAAATDPSRAAP